ncbi:MAG: leucine-rich repeat domain-containing protein [Prevotella sp.]|nr:leucine-rich repeat domain-containing protein [Prevotella sp.]
MKKLLTIMLAMLPLAAFSQTWRPLVEEGKTWELKTYFDEFPYNYDYVAHISGDTIVDGQACKKYFRNGKLYAFLHEEGQKVYYRYSHNMDYWQLIYDFSLMPGDTVTDEYGYAHEVERVDTITGATGEPFRRIIFKFVPGSGLQPVWVSGIGGRQALDDPWVYTPGDYCHLTTCEVDGRLLFEGDEMMLGIVSGDRESGIVKVGGLKYRLDDERHEATLEMQNRWNGELEIPSTVEYGEQTYTVTNMKAHAFSGCQTLTRVTLPATISITSDNPFVSCNSLEAIEVDAANPWLRSVGGVLLSVDGKRLYCYPAGAKAESCTVPDGVEVIGRDAFSRNPHLVSVVLPEGVQDISSSAFGKCKSLERVELPSSLSNINDEVFMECTSLKDIVISDGVKHIGHSAFYGCSGLERVDVPEGVTSIGSSAFSKCTSLRAASVPSTVATVGNYLFSDCTSLTDVALADGIGQVGVQAFQNCTSLKVLDLPKSITKIEGFAFEGCHLDTLKIWGQFMRKDLNTGLFRGMDASATLCVHWSEVDLFKEVYPGTVLPVNEGVPDDSYYSMLKIGKVWNIRESQQDDAGEETERNYSLRIVGDTIIGRNTYYVMRAEGDKSPLVPSESYWQEEDRRVKVRGDGTKYIFNMKLGTSFMNSGGDDVCTSVDCVEMDDRRLRQFELTCHDGRKISWIESIGNVEYGPLFPFGHDDADGITVTLVSVYEDGKCIYLREGCTDFTGISVPKENKASSSGAFFDLQGRRVQGQPRPGVYVRDGRKQVVR